MHKTNVLTFAGDLWERTFNEVAAEHPDVATAYNHVDAACIYFVQSPQQYDVVVTDNLFGDILTDLGGAVSGGIGFASSGNLNPARTGPSMFEPVHGSAPDIAGQNKANPVAAILSAALMLDHLGEGDAAARVRKACAEVTTPHRLHHRDRRPGRRPPLAARVEGRTDMPITPTEKIWMNGELVDWDDARIHILTHTLHYGMGVFEGIRAYETDDGPGVFRLTDHIERLFRSARRSSAWRSRTRSTRSCRPPRTRSRPPGLPGCYIRPIAYYGYGEMGLNTLPCTVDVSIACWPWGAYLGDDALTKGVRMKISSWTRHDHNTMPPASKTTGNYVNSSLAKVEALKAGYDEALMLEPAGLRLRVHRREHLRGAPRPPHHPAASAPARSRASPRTRVIHLAKDMGFEVVFGELTAQRPLRRRRDVRGRHRRRGERGAARSTTARSRAPAR